MDGNALQAKLYKGYSKASAHVGVPYSYYRSATHLLPTAATNRLGSLPVAFSPDRHFEMPNKYHNPVLLCYADGRKLKQFDFLVGPMGTFFIGDMQLNLPIQSVETNRTVTLSRAGYSVSGPLSGTPTAYATGLPVFIQYKREEIKPLPYVNSAGEGVPRCLAFIPLPNGILRQDDEMVDEEGTRYFMDACDYTSIGYVASVRHSAL